MQKPSLPGYASLLASNSDLASVSLKPPHLAGWSYAAGMLATTDIVKPAGVPTSLYGFFLAAHNHGWNVLRVVQSLRTFHPDSHVTVFTDNGRSPSALNFSSLCLQLGCFWDYSWYCSGHGYACGGSISGLPFVFRMLATMQRCDCDFVIYLEDDVCVHRPILAPPPISGDVGGLAINPAPKRFIKWLRDNNRSVPLTPPPLYGCNTGCYYRSASWLSLPSQYPQIFSNDSFKKLYHEGARVQYADAVGPVIMMLVGGNVVPWDAGAEKGLRLQMSRGQPKLRAGVSYEYNRSMHGVAFVHKCREMLTLRKNTAMSPLWSRLRSDSRV